MAKFWHTCDHVWRFYGNCQTLDMLLIPSFKASAPVPTNAAMCTYEAKRYAGVPGWDKENNILPSVNSYWTCLNKNKLF